jgi:hypothetical protein
MGLTINQVKTKYMGVSNKNTKEKHIVTDNKNTEKVNEFQYPGSTVTFNNNINVEINHKITMENKYYYVL